MEPYQKSLKGKLKPLICWDIYHAHFQKQHLLQQDLEQILNLVQQHQWQTALNFRKLLQEEYTLVVTNPQKEITWVSSGFIDMTGYAPSYALNKKPGFLQGPDTDSKMVKMISAKLAQKEKVSGKLINYRKGGIPYLCGLEIHPLFTSRQQFSHFIALEKEIV
ncbi:PAS domain-containing protein [Rapidithrix thailandica]|uniref:PAS domain-containing protein n=1 Tax=Rapidithrix thailandica TaxID=413964 RepID=A0AAW9RZ19_9BACT